MRFPITTSEQYGRYLWRKPWLEKRREVRGQQTWLGGLQMVSDSAAWPTSSSQLLFQNMQTPTPGAFIFPPQPFHSCSLRRLTYRTPPHPSRSGHSSWVHPYLPCLPCLTFVLPLWAGGHIKQSLPLSPSGARPFQMDLCHPGTWDIT